MPTQILFIRGINVGGNHTLPMKDLAALCTKIGLLDVRTYINSGNVVFESALSESALESRIEKALHEKMGKSISVTIRTAGELKSIVAKNPFPKAVPAQVGVLLFKKPESKKILDEFVIPGTEQVAMGKREIYIHYTEGMGRSKLKIPKPLSEGTMRNINTLTKLSELADTK